MATKAELVKELRKLTNAGMTDCLKALDESQNNIEAAIEWLRKNGAIKAAKKAGAIAAEGITIAKFDPLQNIAVVAEVNCQTDFVAKNEQFIQLTNDIVDAIIKNPNVDTAKLKINGQSIQEACEALTATIGEKISFRRSKILKGIPSTTLGVYTHMNNRVATAVLIYGDVDKEMATNVAMHIAAMNPKYVRDKEVDVDWLNKEKEIIAEQARQESDKPAEFLQKIIDGRVNKVLKEVCLESQAYVKDPSITVQQYLGGKHAAVIAMANFVLGEGIQKKESDFASEVAEQMNQVK